MKAVIHRGKHYEQSLRAFHQKRIDFLEHEIRSFDQETLRAFLNSLQAQNRTLANVTGIAV